MADPEHLDILKQGVEAWNQWRQNHPDIQPNLSQANLQPSLEIGLGNVKRPKARALDFTEVDLSGADLSGASFHMIDMSKTNLSRANLKDATFFNVDLSRANLSRVDLSEAVFVASSLSNANLSGANLSKAHLQEGNLKEANLFKANLSGANLFFTNLSGANLSGANLSGIDLRNALLGAASLSRLFLTNARLVPQVLSIPSLSNELLNKTLLNGANLNGADLSGANLDEVNLQGSSFRRADLRRASLSGADLSGVILSEANLAGANLNRANLSEADLSHADLSRANLMRSILVSTNLENAILTNCLIYGIAAWNVQQEGAKQDNLIITPSDEPTITVDNLKIAQFIYLLLNNTEIREVIDTITSKVVLILGRFTDERKKVLDALRDELRKRNYSPVLFDFEKPASRDITEMVSTLAHMARFVIADITDAKSIPQELMIIVPNLPSVPVQPLLLESQREYGMFEHFTRFPWVLPVYHYMDEESLLQSLKEKVIAPAEQKAQKLAKR